MATISLHGEEMEQFPSFLKEFSTYKSIIENQSEKTVCEYLYDIRTFLRYMVCIRNKINVYSDDFQKVDISNLTVDFLKEITEQDIYAFLNYVASDRNNSWAARARKITTLRVFFKYCFKNKNWIETNPMSNIESPKRQNNLPKYLTLEESLALLECVKNDSTSKTRERDLCMITLFLNCGLRVSELVSINLTDIKPKLESITVIGKGRKERIVYLNDACKKALIRYITWRQEKHQDNLETCALFVSERGDRISVKTVQFVVYKYLDKAGLGGRGLSVHKLRHTAATLMYQYGNVDVRVLKDILGHEQLNTTQIYTHVSNKGMKNAMQSNPLANYTPSKDNDEDEI